MPAVSAGDKAILESGPSSIEYYLAVTPLGLVFQASLNAPAASWGLQTLPFDNVTFGAWGDVNAPMTMWVYASDGTTYKGKIRVRGITAASILVMANYDIEWVDNDILKVYYIYEPWSYPTNMDGDTDPTTYFRDWDLTYPPAGKPSAFWPKANAGVAFAHFLNDSGHVDVPFPGSQSFGFAGATISTYLWDIEDGAFQVGGAGTADITARFSQTGFRYVKLVVTDSGGLNGQQFVPVWTFGGGYQPYQCEIKSRSLEVRDGELTVDCFEQDLTDEDIFPGAQVVLFSREYIDGSEVSIDTDFGAEFASRRQMRFVGWILEDTIVWDSERGSVTFSVGTIGKVADQMPGYGTFIKDVEDTPTTWHEAQGLTVRMAVWQILRWHCNLHELIHMELWDYSSTDPTPDLGGREFSVAPPLKQIESSLLFRRGVFAYLGCSRWSSIHILTDPQMLHYDERALITVITELTAVDVYTEGHAEKLTRPRISHVFGGGIAYDGTVATPFRSRTPGLIGRESGRKERAENLIIVNQDDLNDLLGRLLGKRSNPWEDMPLETMWDIFEPALQEYVDLNADVFDNDPRESYPGVDQSVGTAWIVRRVQIEDAALNAPVVNLTLERLAKIYRGVTVLIPDIPDIPPPSPPPPFLPLFAAQETTIRALVGTWAAGVFYNAQLEGPTGDSYPWTAVNDGLDGYRYSIRVELDPFDEHNRQYYLVSDEDSQVYHGDLFRRENQGSWTSILTAAEAATVIGETNAVIYDISADEANDGFLYGGVYDTDNWDVWVIKSEDYGDTWSPVNLVVGNVWYENKYWSMLNIKVYGSRIFLTVFDEADGDSFYYISDDGGSSFTESASFTQNNFSDHPVFLNALQPTPYFCGEKSGVTTYATLCRFDSPDDFETVIPAVGLGSDHLYYIWDEQVWGSSVNVGVYSGIDYSGTPDVLHYTDDNWATYNTVNLGNTSCRMHWRDPEDEDLYFFAGGGYVWTSTDRGVTLTLRGAPTGGVVWGCFKPYRSSE